MIYGVVFVFSVILTYGIRILALKKSLLAKVNERSSHTTPIPHGGGIAIALTWFFGLVYLFTCNRLDASLFYALMCGMLLSLVSYLDDVYELSPKLRLIVQVLVSSAGLYALGGLSVIDVGFYTIENQVITNGIAFIGIIWCINLYNFLDGIDGYAGSEALFLALAGWLFFGGDHFLVLGASVAGFLVWNWHRAKIFMGDVGSTLLGYTIAIFALYYQNSGHSIFIWVILFGLFWFDATVTLFRRLMNGEKISQAHRKHAYQRAVQSGFKHDSVVLFGVGANIIFLTFGYGALKNPQWLFVWFGLTLILLYILLKVVDKRKKFL